MNTLSKTETATFFTTPEDYLRLRAHWSALQRSDRRTSLAAAHHLLYLALLGKDWRRGFAPISNQRKLANGALYGWGLYRALPVLLASSREQETWLLEPFADLVTPEMLARLPLPAAVLSDPAALAAGRFPFEAYTTGTGTAR